MDAIVASALLASQLVSLVLALTALASVVGMAMLSGAVLVLVAATTNDDVRNQLSHFVDTVLFLWDWHSLRRYRRDAQHDAAADDHADHASALVLAAGGGAPPPPAPPPAGGLRAMLMNWHYDESEDSESDYNDDDAAANVDDDDAGQGGQHNVCAHDVINHIGSNRYVNRMNCSLCGENLLALRRL
jgi:hypothetical protein